MPLSLLDPLQTFVAPPGKVLHPARLLLRDLVTNQLRSSAVAHQIAASAVAITAYIVAALCVGWVVSTLLEPLGYVWPRFAAEAAISTCLGMIASLRLTRVLFPNRSGRGVFAAFAGVVLLVLLAGWSSSMNWLHTGQALLLVALAYGLFWPHRRGSR